MLYRKKKCVWEISNIYILLLVTNLGMGGFSNLIKFFKNYVEQVDRREIVGERTFA